jgi:hypothetical protein
MGPRSRPRFGGLARGKRGFVRVRASCYTWAPNATALTYFLVLQMTFLHLLRSVHPILPSCLPNPRGIQLCCCSRGFHVRDAFPRCVIPTLGRVRGG